MSSHAKLALIAVIVGVLLFGLWRMARVGASESHVSTNGDRAVPVTSDVVQAKTVPIEFRAIGQVEPYTTVDIHPQVSGQLQSIVFHEGDFVKKGDVLFGIDPRTNQADVQEMQANYDKALATVRQAEAALAKDQVLARTAAVEAERYSQLVDSGVVSRELYDQMRTNSDAAAASVKADTEAVDSARRSADAAGAVVSASKIQLGYTTIVAPMDGRTGALTAHRGDVVGPNDQQPLVVIAQVEPIQVTFSIPESQFVELKSNGLAHAVSVTAVAPSDPDAKSLGTLTFVDYTVDTTTGTIKLKATFENSRRQLWPGQFVNVVVTIGAQPNAIIAPSRAIETGQQGQYVFVIAADNTVEMRPVAVQRYVDADAVISAGLQSGERVVTDGQLKLTPGTSVQDLGAGTDSSNVGASRNPAAAQGGNQ